MIIENRKKKFKISAKPEKPYEIWTKANNCRKFLNQKTAQKIHKTVEAHTPDTLQE